MKREQTKLPHSLVWAVLVLCTLPALFNLAGVSFSAQSDTLGSPTGKYVHTILEWTSCCIALFTAIFAFTHYFVARDVAMPVIGAALFFSGMIDAFQVLAADGLILQVGTQKDFIPFTWAVSRTFNVCFLIAGTAPFIWSWIPHTARSRERGLRFILLVAVLFGVMAYAIIQICALLKTFPKTVFEGHVARPWDLIPLGLYLFAGAVVFPRFYRLHPSLFSHALMLSVIPQIWGEIYAVFGSPELFGNSFNISCYLKIVANLVPLAGLLLDYTRAYKTEVTLRTTEAKLRVAHDVQQRLLPTNSPEVPGFDVAGCSFAADVIGGDYFDYIPMQDGSVGIVVADVSGHEIGASIVLAQTRAYLRAMVETQPGVSEIVTQLNKFLVDIVHNRWFVELFFVQLDPHTHSIVYAAAGHESYLIDAGGHTRTFETMGPPLGVLEKGSLPCSAPTPLTAGDILLMLTDGVTEAKSPQGEQFTVKRVIETVIAHRERPAHEIVAAVVGAVAAFRQQTPQQDDITLVLIKRCADA